MANVAANLAVNVAWARGVGAQVIENPGVGSQRCNLHVCFRCKSAADAASGQKRFNRRLLPRRLGGEPVSPMQPASIPRVAGGAREGDGVADVGEAGDVGEGALEAEAEAGVRHRAVAAQVAVPGVVLPVDAALDHAAVQYFEPLLALAAADYL